jgi:YfiH family protein
VLNGTLKSATLPVLAEIPGLVHGFEQRLGPPGWETRESGRRRVSEALASAGRLLLLSQVHGTRVRVAPWEGCPEGDAATVDRPGLLLGVETADCLPVVLVDPRRRAAAVAHAGWRGTAAGVARIAAEALLSAGSRAEDLIAGLGPGIGPCCYEVGEDVRSAFEPGGSIFFTPGPRGRPHLDVRAANEHQLRAAGLHADRVHHLADCTFCRADLYHSYRREGRGAGRMISHVGWARA